MVRSPKGGSSFWSTINLHGGRQEIRPCRERTRACRRDRRPCGSPSWWRMCLPEGPRQPCRRWRETVDAFAPPNKGKVSLGELAAKLKLDNSAPVAGGGMQPTKATLSTWRTAEVGQRGSSLAIACPEMVNLLPEPANWLRNQGVASLQYCGGVTSRRVTPSPD
jgi:hypothetical protein